jgi:hypothetical protein
VTQLCDPGKYRKDNMPLEKVPDCNSTDKRTFGFCETAGTKDFVEGTAREAVVYHALDSDLYKKTADNDWVFDDAGPYGIRSLLGVKEVSSTHMSDELLSGGSEGAGEVRGHVRRAANRAKRGSGGSEGACASS